LLHIAHVRRLKKEKKLLHNTRHNLPILTRE